MYLSESDQVRYLANIVFLANADGSFSAEKAAALEAIRLAIGAKKGIYDKATKRALGRDFQLEKVDGFSGQVSNLADMLYVSIIDGELSESERKIIRAFSREIDLTEEQSNCGFSIKGAYNTNSWLISTDSDSVLTCERN